MPTELLPADSKDLVLDEVSFRNLVSRQLHSLHDLPFSDVEEDDSRLNMSGSIGHILLMASAQNALAERGYQVRNGGDMFIIRSTREKHKRIVTWYVNHCRLEFELLWHLHPRGVEIVLETEPRGGDGNHEDAALLARLMHQFISGGFSTIEIERLSSRKGRRSYSWKDLNLEPSVDVTDFFEKRFLKIFGENEEGRRYARDKSNDELRSSPHGRVPRSREKALLEHWLHSYRQNVLALLPR